MAELRRRLGGRFAAQELVDLYDSGHIVVPAGGDEGRPEGPWAWEAGVVVDAAFGRYLREAADYAGGRREIGRRASRPRRRGG